MSWLKRFLPIVDDRPPVPGNGFGFQVLKNTSPHLAIEPWFDFVCGINGRQIVNTVPARLILCCSL